MTRARPGLRRGPARVRGLPARGARSSPSTGAAPRSATTKRWLGAIARPARPPDGRRRYEVVRGDLLHLPFPDASVDRVMASEVLEHIPDDVAAMAEIVRVLQARRPDRRHRAALRARSGSAGRCRTRTTRTRAATSASTAGDARPHPAARRPVCSPYGTHHAHAPARARTGGSSARSAWTDDTALPVRAYHRLLVWDIMKRPLAHPARRAAARPADRQEPRRLRRQAGLAVPRRRPARDPRGADRCRALTRPTPAGAAGGAHRATRPARPSPASPPSSDADGAHPLVPRRPPRPVGPRRGGDGPGRRRASTSAPSAAYGWLAGPAAPGRLLGRRVPRRRRVAAPRRARPTSPATSPSASGTTGCATGDEQLPRPAVAGRARRPGPGHRGCSCPAARSAGRATRRHARRHRAADRQRQPLPGAALRARARRAPRGAAARLGAGARPPRARRSASHPERFPTSRRYSMDWYYPVLGGALTGPGRPARIGRGLGPVRRPRPGRALRRRPARG